MLRTTLFLTVALSCMMTACMEDKKNANTTAQSIMADTLNVLPPSVAELDATKSVSDKEINASKSNNEPQSSDYTDAKTAKVNKKPTAKTPEKPVKPPVPAPKTDTKAGNTPSDKVKKRAGKDDVFIISEVAPKYPGGEGGMTQYLQKNIKYPSSAQEQGVKGTVLVQFVVEKDGKVSDVTIVRSVAKSLDAEAKRVVAAMPTWAAGKQNGKAVAVQYTLPIKFALVE